MLGVFVYLLAGEFFAEDSPQKIYSSALSLVREDGRCQDLFGPTIAGFGEETSRGRRRHVAHHKYEKDGRQRIRVLFHVKMEDDGFKLVRRRRQYSRLKKATQKSVDRIEGTVDDIQAAVEKADALVEESGLSSWIIDNVRLFLGKRCISRVYLIGNGHLDAPWEPGAHQFALIQKICSAFNAEMVFQEPCISNAEREWLSHQEGIAFRDQPDVSFDVTGECDRWALDHEDSVSRSSFTASVHSRITDRGKALSTGKSIWIPESSFLWLCGRHPETGRKINQHIGGGVKFDYYMIDYHSRGPTEPGKTYDERVLEVRRDPNRSSHIALVAGTEGKRWILATENMKAGDIISTTCHIPENPVIGVEGNSYPVGSLVAGTLINSVERYPTLAENLDIVCFRCKKPGYSMQHCFDTKLKTSHVIRLFTLLFVYCLPILDLGCRLVN
ncbi:Ribosomal Proteins L2, RNA binding domain protein [Cooperia oncophora]